MPSPAARLTEIVYALGAEERIVAVDETSNYPEAALELPSVGYVRNLSAEGILSLEPTLVLGEHDMGPEAVLEQIRQTSVEVVRAYPKHTRPMASSPKSTVWRRCWV
ncbi:MAG: ABC transporter substrate-binding protein [Gammaproteobacteria bacterium]|nr:ABC transporter substrate-binding protein [Gammaproteobacteria bacterium]